MSSFKDNLSVKFIALGLREKSGIVIEYALMPTHLLS